MQLERLNHKHKLNKQHVYVEYNWVGWQYPAEVWWGDESVSGNYWYEAEEGEGGNEMYRKDWTIYVRKKVLSARLHNDEISNKWQRPHLVARCRTLWSLFLSAACKQPQQQGEAHSRWETRVLLHTRVREARGSPYDWRTLRAYI